MNEMPAIQITPSGVQSKSILRDTPSHLIAALHHRWGRCQRSCFTEEGTEARGPSDFPKDRS